MTDDELDLPAAFEALFGRPPREVPHDEATEQRMSFYAETYDEHDQTTRRLRRTR